MTVREASCSCGKLRISCEGEPVRISACHCLACQRRSGSAFAAHGRWPIVQVHIGPGARQWERIPDSGRTATYHFCPQCGSTIAALFESFPGLVAIPIGAFADPYFPWPQFSAYEQTMHGWVEIVGERTEHSSTPCLARHHGRARH